MKLNPDRAKSPEQLAWENGYGQGFANAKAMCDHKAAQPLTDEQIVRLWESSTGHKMPNMGSSMWQLLAVARAIECACAEAWGVKLGATTGEQQ